MKLDDFYGGSSAKEKTVYKAVSSSFEVTVQPEYISEQSAPDQDYYFFAYHVTIKNVGTEPATLTFRHWVITDGHGNVEEVMGDGVVGEKPEILPGHDYCYSSFCPLATPTGNMRGKYDMTDSSGIPFTVEIPLFFLRHPRTFQ